ncbi:MAG: hypothetical protein KatS3mg009_2073 [Acidimicrobiia bacterium]|nr:MAG: hypothetical protein KatS3mg009_2073 [Acidimicrobiia bacterium]
MTTAIEAGPVDSRFAWDAGATLLDLFEARVRDDGTRVAMRHRDDAGSWRSITWADYGRAVHEVASGLAAIGIRPGDRVGILAWNRPEWHEADLGILRAGAISVPVYPTSAGPQVAYVLAHSGCRVCFVGDREQLDRVRDQLAELPALECIVTFDDVDALDDPLVRTLEELRALGGETPAVPPAVTPEHVATLVYTSGTTGPPKGAVITHKNAMATLRSVTQVVPLTEQERFLSFLPLSHITERSVSHFGLVASGGETWFARSISTIAEDLPACRPTIFFAVPRVWEKLREGVEAAVAQLSGPGGALARRYLDYARRGVDRLGPADRVARQALDLVVGRRLRAQIGLDAARFCVSGAAPIHPELLRWFAGIGIPIAEGYGQTEVALATTLNPPDAIRVGTVGPPLPGVTVRIAEDGEILVRGDNVCRGYWDDEARHPRAARPRRLAALRRPRVVRRPRLPAHHRPQEGPDHHRARQEHRAADARDRPGREHAARRAGRRRRGGAALPDGAPRAGRRGGDPLGGRTRQGRTVRGPDARPRRARGDPACRRGGERPPLPGRADPQVAGPAGRAHRRGR